MTLAAVIFPVGKSFAAHIFHHGVLVTYAEPTEWEKLLGMLREIGIGLQVSAAEARQ